MLADHEAGAEDHRDDEHDGGGVGAATVCDDTGPVVSVGCSGVSLMTAIIQDAARPYARFRCELPVSGSSAQLGGSEYLISCDPVVDVAHGDG